MLLLPSMDDVKSVAKLIYLTNIWQNLKSNFDFELVDVINQK